MDRVQACHQKRLSVRGRAEKDRGGDVLKAMEKRCFGGRGNLQQGGSHVLFAAALPRVLGTYGSHGQVSHVIAFAGVWAPK